MSDKPKGKAAHPIAHYARRSNPSHPWGNNWLLSTINLDDKGYVWLRPNSPLVRKYGCRTCDWKGSKLCPYRDDESFKNKGAAANGYCSDRIIHFKMINDDWTKGGAGQSMQIGKIIMLDSRLDKLQVEISDLEEKYLLTQDPEDARRLDRLNERFDKLNFQHMDMLAKIRKQDEGSKLNVKHKVTPGDIANLLNDAKESIVDAEVVEEDD